MKASNSNKTSKTAAARVKPPQQIKQAKCSTQNKLQKNQSDAKIGNTNTQITSLILQVTQQQKEKQAMIIEKQKIKSRKQICCSTTYIFAQFDHQSSNT